VIDASNSPVAEAYGVGYGQKWFLKVLLARFCFVCCLNISITSHSTLSLLIVSLRLWFHSFQTSTLKKQSLCHRPCLLCIKHCSHLKSRTDRGFYTASRHRAIPCVAAVQCNAYGKFQCESGDSGAVPCRAAVWKNVWSGACGPL